MSTSATSTPRPPPEPSLHESDACPVAIGPVSEAVMHAVDIALARLNVPESDREKVKEGVRQRVKSRFTKVESTAWGFIKAHPVTSGLILVSAGICFTPPLLHLAGFGALGPVKGSLAAWAQGTFYGGTIPSGSVFSILQRAGMVMGGSIGDIICALAPLFGFAVGWMLKLFTKPVQS